MLVNTGVCWLTDAFAGLRCKVGLAVRVGVIEGMIEGVGAKGKMQLRNLEVFVMRHSQQEVL